MEFNTGLFSYVKMKGHEEMKVWKGEVTVSEKQSLVMPALSTGWEDSWNFRKIQDATCACKVNNLGTFSKFKMLYNCHLYLAPEHLQKKPIPIHQLVTPTLTYPQLLATTNPLSVSTDLSILDISYKWNRTICDLLCLVLSLSIMLSRFKNFNKHKKLCQRECST